MMAALFCGAFDIKGRSQHNRAVNDRRRQLMDAAHQVLLHYGPRKTTIHDIARAAGVAVGTVYLEFANKAALLAAVYEGQLTHAERAMADALRDGDLRQAVRAAFDARTEVYWEMGRGGAHAKDVARPFCAAVKTVWHAHLGRVRNLLEVRLAGAMDQPQRTAQALVTVYARFEPGDLAGAERARVQAALDDVHDLVLPGLNS